MVQRTVGLPKLSYNNAHVSFSTVVYGRCVILTPKAICEYADHLFTVIPMTI